MIFDTLPSTTDIIASRAGFPYELGRKGGVAGKWGATCCMGFVLFKATLRTQRFVTLANAILQDEKDDQRWINFALSTMHIKWPEVEKGGKLLDHGMGVPTSIGRVPALRLEVCTCVTLVVIFVIFVLFVFLMAVAQNKLDVAPLYQVALLDPMLVLRHCGVPAVPRTVVEHCIVAKKKNTNKLKINAMRKRHTWFIRDNPPVNVSVPANSTRAGAWTNILRHAQSTHLFYPGPPLR